MLIYFIVCEGCRGWEYPGEQVWRLQVETTAQMEALASLEADHRMDFWTEVRLCVWGGGGLAKDLLFCKRPAASYSPRSETKFKALR